MRTLLTAKKYTEQNISAILSKVKAKQHPDVGLSIKMSKKQVCQFQRDFMINVIMIMEKQML